MMIKMLASSMRFNCEGKTHYKAARDSLVARGTKQGYTKAGIQAYKRLVWCRIVFSVLHFGSSRSL